ncbi:response regulator transcription factor [Nocardioides panacisoli]|uniref:response regulator transcription factor n=1 Tax=Nocardioides panacisoli TaxID=627624 RepID=UPI001C6372E2|nr:response regulator transcription factor [Nocardioides panacisoli]QYJ03517.1 response regulator transcription factor [Nocardioides panacisoli]
MEATMSITLEAKASGPESVEERCRPQRVLVVDDHELTQAGLRAVLGCEPWVASCLGAGSVQAAWDIARRHHPQIVLLSTSVQGRPWTDLCRLLQGQMPYVKIVLMSADGAVPVPLAQSRGAVGFLPTQLPVPGIVAAVRRVAEGGRAFPKGAAKADAVHLSRRELDVLRHLVAGLSNPEVAARLNLSRHTVKQHASGVYRKLGVRNRAEAASRAHMLGLVT